MEELSALLAEELTIRGRGGLDKSKRGGRVIKGGGRTLMEKESESKAREEVKRALREEAEHVAKKGSKNFYGEQEICQNE